MIMYQKVQIDALLCIICKGNYCARAHLLRSCSSNFTRCMVVIYVSAAANTAGTPTAFLFPILIGMSSKRWLLYCHAPWAPYPPFSKPIKGQKVLTIFTESLRLHCSLKPRIVYISLAEVKNITQNHEHVYSYSPSAYNIKERYEKTAILYNSFEKYDGPCIYSILVMHRMDGMCRLFFTLKHQKDLHLVVEKPETFRYSMDIYFPAGDHGQSWAYSRFRWHHKPC